MFNHLYISTVILIIFMHDKTSKFPTIVRESNFHTMHATSSVSQRNITMTSSTHGTISGRKRQIPMSDKRISGGTVIKPHSWPYLVKVVSFPNDSYTYHCGATVYNESFIITAAHCVNKYKPDQVIVIAGEHSTIDDEEQEQVRLISQIILHPLYNEFNEHDIALLQLNRLLNLKTDYVKVIEINTDMSCPAPNANCSAAGWGQLSEKGSVPKVPSEAVLSVMSTPNCQQVKDPLYELVVSDVHVCAGDSTSGKSVCRGDSGGPLICNCGGKNKLAGISSMIKECGNRLYPGIFTRVPCYSEWIKTGSENYLCKGIWGSNGNGNGNGSNFLSLGNTIALICVLYWCAPFLFTDRL